MTAQKIKAASPAWNDAFTALCLLRCKAAGLGDTACMDVCGEAGEGLADNQPSCGEILEALGFENDSEEDWLSDDD